MGEQVEPKGYPEPKSDDTTFPVVKTESHGRVTNLSATVVANTNADVSANPLKQVVKNPHTVEVCSIDGGSSRAVGYTEVGVGIELNRQSESVVVIPRRVLEDLLDQYTQGPCPISSPHGEPSRISPAEDRILSVGHTETFDRMSLLIDFAAFAADSRAKAKIFERSNKNFKVVKLKKLVKALGPDAPLKKHHIDYIMCHPVQYTNWLVEYHDCSQINGSHGEFTGSDDVAALPLHLISAVAFDSFFVHLYNYLYDLFVDPSMAEDHEVVSQINGAQGEFTGTDDIKDHTKGKAKKPVKKAAKPARVVVVKEKKVHKTKPAPKMTTRLGPRRKLLDGVFAANSSDTTQHSWFNGVDSKALAAEGPVKSWTGPFCSIPISPDALASYISGASPDGEVPGDLGQLCTQYAGVEWSEISFKLTLDVPPLVGGKIGVLFTPDEVPVNPLNINQAWDSRDQTKCKDHWQFDFINKSDKKFILPKIPGTKPVRGVGSVAGHLCFFIREPLLVANTSGGQPVPYEGKIGTIHVALQMFGQYRMLKSNVEALYREVSTQCPLSTHHPAKYVTSVGADAMMVPLCTMLDPDLVQAAVNTYESKPANGQVMTISLLQAGTPVLFSIPVIFTPILELLATGIGVPPGIATMVVTAVNAFAAKGAYDSNTFETDVHAIQQANNQSGSGIVGGLTTGSGVVTSVAYQPGVNLADIMVTAAYLALKSEYATSWRDMSQALSISESQGIWPLVYTWPEGSADPGAGDMTQFVDSFFESTNTSFPTLKALPTPAAIGKAGPPVPGVAEAIPFTEQDFVPWARMRDVPPIVTHYTKYVDGSAGPGSPIVKYTGPSSYGQSYYFLFQAGALGPMLVLKKVTMNSFTVVTLTGIVEWQEYLRAPRISYYEDSGEQTIGGVMSYRCLGPATEAPAGTFTLDGTTHIPGAVTTDANPFGLCDVVFRPTVSYPSFANERLLVSNDGVGYTLNPVNLEADVVYEVRLGF